MNQSPDPDPLLNDVFRDEALRNTTLANGLARLRRKRIRRTAVRFASAAIAVITIFTVRQRSSRTTDSQTMPPVPLAKSMPPQHTIEGTVIRVIGDEELFRLFENRPLALVGEFGQRRLVLLDEPPTDEEQSEVGDDSDTAAANPNGGS